MNDTTKAAEAVLTQFADIEKRLGELFVLFKAQELTLCSLLPEFEPTFANSLGSDKCRQLKLEAEHRISALLKGLHK